MAVGVEPTRQPQRAQPGARGHDAGRAQGAVAAVRSQLEKPPRGAGPDGRRQSLMPLIEVARTKNKPEALEALETWRSRHPSVAAQLHPADVLVDGMRGSSSLWYRVRVNLQHVPEGERPPQEELIADYDPWAGKVWPGAPDSAPGR